MDITCQWMLFLTILCVIGPSRESSGPVYRISPRKMNPKGRATEYTHRIQPGYKLVYYMVSMARHRSDNPCEVSEYYFELQYNTDPFLHLCAKQEGRPELIVYKCHSGTVKDEDIVHIFDINYPKYKLFASKTDCKTMKVDMENIYYQRPKIIGECGSSSAQWAIDECLQKKKPGDKTPGAFSRRLIQHWTRNQE